MNNRLNKAPFATHFFTDAFNISGDEIMGRQAAGNSYLSALFKENYENIALYVASVQEDPRIEENKRNIMNFLSSSVDYSPNTKISLIPYTSPNESNSFGGIFRPDPNLDGLAKHRAYYNHDAYSLIGITHTTATHGIMTTIKDMILAPLMPWDALICTSDSVRQTVEAIHSDYYEYLNLRLGIKKKPKFQLPVIPLGINPDEFERKRDVNKIKENYGINEGDINIIFVGRISFHAKAHNIPMFLALEKLSKEVKDQKINFIMAGWFPNDAVEEWIREDARNICPSVNLIYVDGRDQDKKFEVFSIGDIFFSLTDNIQETFGLTPLEAMAAGMPVVVSDWNGYRETVRNGVDGFRIQTTSFPESVSNAFAFRHDMGVDTYDRYCGYHSLFTSVDIQEAIEKLKLLIMNEDLRHKLGSNAKKHAFDNFSWSKIFHSYEELKQELQDIREKEGKLQKELLNKVSSDRLPPFHIFSSYPTRFIDTNTKINKLKGINNIEFKDLIKSETINYASIILPDLDNVALVLEHLDEKKSISIKKLKNKTSLSVEDIMAIVTLLLKYGYINIKD